MKKKKSVRLSLVHIHDDCYLIRSVTNSLEWQPGARLNKKQVEIIVERGDVNVTFTKNK